MGLCHRVITKYVLRKRRRNPPQQYLPLRYTKLKQEFGIQDLVDTTQLGLYDKIYNILTSLKYIENNKIHYTNKIYSLLNTSKISNNISDSKYINRFSNQNNSSFSSISSLNDLYNPNDSHITSYPKLYSMKKIYFSPIAFNADNVNLTGLNSNNILTKRRFSTNSFNFYITKDSKNDPSELKKYIGSSNIKSDNFNNIYSNIENSIIDSKSTISSDYTVNENNLKSIIEQVSNLQQEQSYVELHSDLTKEKAHTLIREINGGLKIALQQELSLRYYPEINSTLYSIGSYLNFSSVFAALRMFSALPPVPADISRKLWVRNISLSNNLYFANQFYSIHCGWSLWTASTLNITKSNILKDYSQNIDNKIPNPDFPILFKTLSKSVSIEDFQRSNYLSQYETNNQGNIDTKNLNSEKYYSKLLKPENENSNSYFKDDSSIDLYKDNETYYEIEKILSKTLHTAQRHGWSIDITKNNIQNPALAALSITNRHNNPIPVVIRTLPYIKNYHGIVLCQILSATASTYFNRQIQADYQLVAILLELCLKQNSKFPIVGLVAAAELATCTNFVSDNLFQAIVSRADQLSHDDIFRLLKLGKPWNGVLKNIIDLRLAQKLGYEGLIFAVVSGALS